MIVNELLEVIYGQRDRIKEHEKEMDTIDESIWYLTNIIKDYPDVKLRVLSSMDDLDEDQKNLIINLLGDDDETH